MNKILISALAIVAASVFGGVASADQILAPGELREIGGETVLCQAPSPTGRNVFWCRCGYTFNGYQDFGSILLYSDFSRVQKEAKSLCLPRAQNSTQRLLMEASECQSMAIEQP